MKVNKMGIEDNLLETDMENALSTRECVCGNGRVEREGCAFSRVEA